MRALLPRAVIALCVLAASACGAGADQTAAETLSVSPQNTTLLVGTDRISIALLDAQQNPVRANAVTVQVVDARGHSLETSALQDVGPAYGGIPVYIGIARFPDVGQYEFLVRGRRTDNQQLFGHAFVTVRSKGSEVPVGARVPIVRQPVLGDRGVTVRQLDSGIPPDTWHSATVAEGTAQHRPMVLYFGDPAYCPTKTCGPTHQILEQLCARFCHSMLFEHIETYFPAGPPGPNAHVNPAFTAFGLQTDPWVYFVTASGIVSDRYEGPVILSELVESAEGTLAGKVPAVSLRG